MSKKNTAAVKHPKGSAENPHKLERGYVDEFKVGYTVYWVLEGVYNSEVKPSKWRWEEIETHKSETAAKRELKVYVDEFIDGAQQIAEREYWAKQPNRKTVDQFYKKITAKTTDEEIASIVEEAKAIRDKMVETPLTPEFKWTKEDQKKAKDQAAKMYRVKKVTVHMAEEIVGK